METRSTVLVTGGTGFIGGWAIVELLRQGYDVRATVRDRGKEAWLREQISTQIDPGGLLSFAVADLTSDVGWDAAVAGCDYVLHVAAPVGVDAPRDPNELIIPTRDGALRVLAAAARAGVRRVVMTSAIEACRTALNSPDGVFDEHQWTNANDPGLGPYRVAKTLAERAAWDFIKARSGPMTLATVLPAAVLGPVFSAQYPHASPVIRRMLGGQLPGLPRVGFCVVDVRDVVDLHIRAMVAPGAAGERFIAASDWMWMTDVAGTLRSALGASASQVPTRKVPDFVLRMVALADRPARFLVPLLGRRHIFSSAKAQAMLGWKPRTAETTIIDTGRSLIALAAV